MDASPTPSYSSLQMNDSEERRLQLNIRGLSKTHHIMMLITPEMKKVNDLVVKILALVKQGYYGNITSASEERYIRIYKGKYYIPNDEDISTIKNCDQVIVFLLGKE